VYETNAFSYYSLYHSGVFADIFSGAFYIAGFWHSACTDWGSRAGHVHSNAPCGVFGGFYRRLRARHLLAAFLWILGDYCSSGVLRRFIFYSYVCSIPPFQKKLVS